MRNTILPPIRQVAVAVPTYNGFGQRMVDGVLHYLDHGPRWNVNLIRTGMANNIVLPESQWDGLIAAAHFFDVFEDFNKPKVQVGGSFSPKETEVGPDNVGIGRMAADYLSELAYKQVAFYSSKLSSYGTDRLNGFTARAEAVGLTVHVQTATRPGSGKFKTWLEQLPKPIGVFAATDSDAAYIANACRALNIAVPERLAILGVDNDECFCRSTVPPLSSIDNGAFQIGYEAAALLDQLMSGKAPKATRVNVPPVGVVSRRSTDTLAITDPDVAKAMRYIRENAVEGLRVPEVCRAVAMSRRSLELKFRRTISRTIQQEIRRICVNRALELLARTEMPIADICARTGFTYPSRLAFVIRSEIGVSPRAYRRQHRSR